MTLSFLSCLDPSADNPADNVSPMDLSEMVLLGRLGQRGMHMVCTVGGCDRRERISHGTAFILIGLFLVSGVWKFVISGYGADLLQTGVFAFCPFYLPFHDSTKTKKDELA